MYVHLSPPPSSSSVVRHKRQRDRVDRSKKDVIYVTTKCPRKVLYRHVYALLSDKVPWYASSSSLSWCSKRVTLHAIGAAIHNASLVAIDVSICIGMYGVITAARQVWRCNDDNDRYIEHGGDG